MKRSEDMLLVFDTNVFLQKNEFLHVLSYRFPTNNSTPKFFVGVDDEGRIEYEYAECKWSDPDDPGRVIIEKIFRDSDLYVTRVSLLPNSPPDALFERLRVKKCQTPEPQLFGVAKSSGGGILVCPNDLNLIDIKRVYLKPGVLHYIQDDGVGPEVRTLTEVLALEYQPRGYSPETLSELGSYLSKYRDAHGEIAEREYLEFKEPKKPFLSQELLRESIRAVCAMLNTCEGWVFIGVQDRTGIIVPFPPKYKDSSKPSADQLKCDIYAEANRISPQPGLLVKVWLIPDDDQNNYVIAIRVHHGNQNYMYRSRVEPGRMIKWIRQEGSTVADPN